jgi:hypothetical protein
MVPISGIPMLTDTERWSQEFGPLVKMDFLMRKMIQNDEEKEPCA